MAKHPLQRLSSPSQSYSAILHLAGLACNAFSFHWLITHPNKINEAYGWHFQYLTIIGLALTTFTFIFGLAADLTSSALLFGLKNALSITAAPMEVLITLLYWTLRSIDEKLVLAPDLPRLPLPADCSFHLFPAALLTTDLLLFSPPYGISSSPAFGLAGSIAVAYYFWVEHCHSKNGFYPYPIFEEAGFEGRIALFSGSALVMGTATAGLKWLYGKVNGVDIDVTGPHVRSRVKKTA